MRVQLMVGPLGEVYDEAEPRWQLKYGLKDGLYILDELRQVGYE